MKAKGKEKALDISKEKSLKAFKNRENGSEGLRGKDEVDVKTISKALGVAHVEVSYKEEKKRVILWDDNKSDKEKRAKVEFEDGTVVLLTLFSTYPDYVSVKHEVIKQEKQQTESNKSVSAEDVLVKK